MPLPSRRRPTPARPSGITSDVKGKSQEPRRVMLNFSGPDLGTAVTPL
jgi:hypothetical protein